MFCLPAKSKPEAKEKAKAAQGGVGASTKAEAGASAPAPVPTEPVPESSAAAATPPVPISAAGADAATGDLVVGAADFEADQPGDLGFKIGDRIVVTARNGDWWEGHLESNPGKSGEFPSTYVNPIIS